MLTYPAPLQRNVGNLATHKDMNVMSCMEYGVTSELRLQHSCVKQSTLACAKPLA
jgi:hypothetical protein